jgi:hypothetical protein
MIHEEKRLGGKGRRRRMRMRRRSRYKHDGVRGGRSGGGGEA